MTILNASNKKMLGIPATTAKTRKTAGYQIGSIIDDFTAVNESLIVNDGDPTMLGTAIPFLTAQYADLILNPSSVSISDLNRTVYTQPVVAAALTMLGNLVKNQLGTCHHVNKKYDDYLQKMFKKMDRTIEELVTDMLTALPNGFYVGEKKYISDGRYIYVQDVEPRPAQSILYRVNSQGKLKEDGIIQYYFNNFWTGYGSLLAMNSVSSITGENTPNPYASKGDLNYPLRTVFAQPVGTVVLPRDKCVHMAYKGLDGLDNPYGRSLLRAAYDSGLIRSELNRITRNAANFRSGPIPVIIVDPNQFPDTQDNEAMESIYNAVANLGKTGEDNPFLVFSGINNKSISIEKLESTADLQDNIALMKYYDSMMLLCCLFQADVMGMSDKGSYALGETQQDLIGRNITSICLMIQKTIIEQIVKPMLQVNFDEQEDFGSFRRTDNVAEDIALNIDKLNTCANLGIKLKGEATIELLDLNEEMVESYDAPIIGQEEAGTESQATNFRRAQ